VLDVKQRRTYNSVLLLSPASQILLRVDNQPFSSSQVLFEQRIARGEGNTVISAFNHEIYVSEHGLHLVQTCAVVPEKVRPREGV